MSEEPRTAAGLTFQAQVDELGEGGRFVYDLLRKLGYMADWSISVALEAERGTRRALLEELRAEVEGWLFAQGGEPVIWVPKSAVLALIDRLKA